MVASASARKYPSSELQQLDEAVSIRCCGVLHMREHIHGAHWLRLEPEPADQVADLDVGTPELLEARERLPAPTAPAAGSKATGRAVRRLCSP